MNGQVVRLSEKPPKGSKAKDAICMRDLERQNSFDGHILMQGRDLSQGNEGGGFINIAINPQNQNSHH